MSQEEENKHNYYNSIYTSMLERWVQCQIHYDTFMSNREPDNDTCNQVCTQLGDLIIDIESIRAEVLPEIRRLQREFRISHVLDLLTDETYASSYQTFKHMPILLSINIDTQKIQLQLFRMKKKMLEHYISYQRIKATQQTRNSVANGLFEYVSSFVYGNH